MMNESDIKRFWENVDKRGEDDCWEWKASCMRGGYGGFKYYPDPSDRQNRKQISAHKFAYLVGKGPILNGLIVRHSCDNPKCCNPAHLSQGTQKDNMRDKIKRNRCAHNSGTKNGRSKLNADKVREIRIMIKDGKSNKQIASVYGVNAATIWQIRTGRNWKSIK